MLIQRNIFKKIIRHLDSEKVLLLKGARQVGKTTIIKEILNRLSKKGEKTFYISADEDFENVIFKTPEHFIARLESEVSISSGKVYVFIDEFQYIRNAGMFIKVLHDKYCRSLQFIVTGSSSLEVTKNSEFLTGRKIEFPVDRISFSEFVRFKAPGIEKAFRTALDDLEKWKILYEVHRVSLEILLAQYARYGAYPEILVTDEDELRKTLVRELFSTYIQKDVIAFLKVENVSAFNSLIKVLCSEAAGLLNKQSLSNTLGISINTLNKYLDILQGTYLCHFLPPLFTNTRKEISKMKKIFILDPGLRNFILNRYPLTYDDISGQDAENLAFLMLSHYIQEEYLFYFRTISKAEIDFIIDHGESKTPIEIKFRNRAPNLPVAIRNFSKRYKTRRPIIVTRNIFQASENILHIPLPIFDFFIYRNL
ncbi:MAG: ATP-binding protein [Bacteroidota bacterium]|nr:ATP-binding protein [Bacteroidota bacterium]